MERVLRDPESLGGSGPSGSGSPTAPTPVSKPMIGAPKPAVFQPGSLTGTAPPRPVEGEDAPPKIRAFDQKMGGGKHEDNWNRSPNVTGNGAIHVKSFHCKLTGESLEFLDKQVNEWLDAHPQYEVKMVTSTVGEWMGKLKEPNLIIQVWV